MNFSLSQSKPRFLPTLMHAFSSCSTMISFPLWKNWSRGKKAWIWRLCFIFCPPTLCWHKIASPGPQCGSTAVEKRREPNPSHRKQHCSLFSVTAHKEKVLFCAWWTRRLSSKPLATDVDTVGCGLRCPPKAIVSLVSFSRIEFFLSSRRQPEAEGEKWWKTSGWQSALQGAFLPTGTQAKSFIMGSSRQPLKAGCYKYCVAGKIRVPLQNRFKG